MGTSRMFSLDSNSFFATVMLWSVREASKTSSRERAGSLGVLLAKEGFSDVYIFCIGLD